MGNNTFRIRYTPLAFADLDDIDSHISETLCNPQAAENLLDEMEKSIRQLEHYPTLGFEVNDSYLASKGYRKLSVQNYLVFYLINHKEQEVIIMRVLYGAREYRDLL